MKGYFTDIEKATRDNTDFRRVLFTDQKSQLVLMSILPGEEIGEEVHDDIDQFIRIEAGHGVVTLDGEVVQVSDGSAIVIPAGTKHNVQNTGQDDLKLYTLYTPPEHKDGTVHHTKADALADPHEH